jgi:2,4-dienoyl-CoA reductase-like NADH-dependent reductase (Old Yellow Enzyme family)
MSHLLSPITINKLTLSNRIVMGPMAATSAAADGSPSAQTLAFFEARARGGVALIILGGSIATSRGYDESPFHPVLRFDIDDHIPAFKRLVDTVHAHGTAIIVELMPGFGRMGVPGPDRPIISASPKNLVIPQERFPRGINVPGGRVTPTPKEASIEEIRYYESEMVKAAVRAYKAGMDGAEVAAHMSYFLSSFISPRTNWRTDQYGGSAENRSRMLVNIVRGIREATSPDFVIGLRLAANDYLPDGQGPRGFAEIAKNVEAAGLDYVALSTGAYETMDKSAPNEDGEMVDSGDAGIFKATLSVPVLIQGIHDPQRADQAIASGNGDLVMLARPLLTDPNYARKLIEGRPKDIVKCNRCNHCMLRLVSGMPVRCPLNPEMGRESRTALGESRPVKRYFQGPVEWVVLKLLGSLFLMGIVSAIIRNFRRDAKGGAS